MKTCFRFFAWMVLGSVLMAGAAAAQKVGKAKSDRKAGAIFVFEQDEFWLNLHHFLYVLARAQNKERDAARTAVAGAAADQEQGLAKLKPAEQAAWREAVTAYARGLAKKDMVFDEPLPSITGALAKAGDSRTLKGTSIDPAVSSALEHAAPIYRKAWWPQHRAANLAWERMIREPLKNHGEEILSFITNSYGMQWPAAGYPVHMSAYANWAGAYSIVGNVLVVSSLAPDLKDDYGLETICHEGMHQWDEGVDAALSAAAKRANKRVPGGLSHAMVFYTAGEAVRRAIPGHVPYAEKYGIWNRGLASFKTPLDEIWKPYLDRKGTRDDALTALLARTGLPPKP